MNKMYNKGGMGGESVDDKRYRMQMQKRGAYSGGGTIQELEEELSEEDLKDFEEQRAQDEMDRKMNEAHEKFEEDQREGKMSGGSMLSSPERKEYSGGGKVLAEIFKALSKTTKAGKAPTRTKVREAVKTVKKENPDFTKTKLGKEDYKELTDAENYGQGGGGKTNFDSLLTSMFKEPTELQAMLPKLSTKASREVAGKSGVAGLGVGTLLGGAGTLAVMSDSEEERINPEDYPTYKKDSDSGKAFREAQREAKKEKAEFFEFEGREYNVREAKNVGGKLKYAEGSMLMPPEMEMEDEMPEDTYDNIPEDEKEAAEASQLPDAEMEEDYVGYVLGESLDTEEQEYLMGVLEGDERLSGIFDKVMDVAGEFSGEGEVSGLGTGVSDSIPARLSDGEFVFTKKATDQMGADQLQTMMDEAEKAFDGGYLMKKAFGGLTSEDDMDSYDSEEEVKKQMISANQMPSIR